MTDNNERNDGSHNDTHGSEYVATHSFSSPFMKEVDKLLKQDPRIGWPTERQMTLEKDLHGWFRPGNLQVLEFLIQKNHTYIIELGSWLGVSTSKILQAAPNAVVFAVDIWSNEYFISDTHYDKEDPKFKKILQSAPIYDQFLKNTEEYKVAIEDSDANDGKSLLGLIPMKMDTAEGLTILRDLPQKPDLIYIDASHHYDYVVRDVTDCLNYFPGAIIVGDDWDNGDVRRAVIDVAARFGLEIYTHLGTCWTFEKKGRMDDMIRIQREKVKQEADKLKKRKEMVSASFDSLLDMYAKKKK